jgi:hypothetical protein
MILVEKIALKYPASPDVTSLAGPEVKSLTANCAASRGDRKLLFVSEVCKHIIVLPYIILEFLNQVEISPCGGLGPRGPLARRNS